MDQKAQEVHVFRIPGSGHFGNEDLGGMLADAILYQTFDAVEIGSAADHEDRTNVEEIYGFRRIDLKGWLYHRRYGVAKLDVEFLEPTFDDFVEIHLIKGFAMLIDDDMGVEYRFAEVIAIGSFQFLRFFEVDVEV